MSDNEKVLKAAEVFGVVGVSRVRTLHDGLMHKTYKIEAPTGVYVLQQLHALLSSDATTHDFRNVTQHLQSRGFAAPLCLHTLEDQPVHREGEHAYRLYTFVPGHTVQVARDPFQVKEAGAIVGRFHDAMRDFPHEFTSPLVLHDTPAIHQALTETLAKFANDPLMTTEVKGMGDFFARTLPTLYLPETLPRRATHGDLKISNVLFDDDDYAVSLIDFDTCNRMTLPVEMGDAFRSWCGDDEDRLDNVFAMDRFRGGWEGYYSTARTFIEPEEWQYVVQGILLITMELAARFLTDYFNDSYFGWNQNRYESRREHNLARARGQTALFHSLLRRRDTAEEIVRAVS